MQLVELLFLGVIAVSILASAYMVGLFLHRVRVQRLSLDEVLKRCFSEELSARQAAVVERRSIVSSREHRMQVCTSGADLLVVPGNGYAAVMLPMDVGEDHRDLVQCRVFLN